jgi:hypothetical protein
MSKYTHLHRAESGSVYRASGHNYQTTLPLDLQMGSVVIGNSGDWSTQLRIGADLVLMVDDSDTLRRLAELASDLADNLDKTRAADEPKTPETITQVDR